MAMTRREFINLSAGAVGAQAVPGVGCPDLQLRFGVAQFDKYDPLADIDRLEGWGFDYCEPQVVRVLALTDQQFEAARRRAAASWIHVEVMNSFVPADLKVVGPAVDRSRVDEHIRRALGRAEALGAKVIVFGSGDARMIPPGFPRDQAWRQLQQFLRSVGDEIERRKYGMVIGIEALRAAESNVVNSQLEAYRLAEDTQHPKIQIICDYFHLMSEGENPNVLSEDPGQARSSPLFEPGQRPVIPARRKRVRGLSPVLRESARDQVSRTAEPRSQYGQFRI